MLTQQPVRVLGRCQGECGSAKNTFARIRGLPTPPQPRAGARPETGPRRRHLAPRALRIPGRPAQGRPSQTRRGDPAQGPRMATRLTDDVFDALDQQTVVVLGTGTRDAFLPSLARSPTAVHDQRRALEAQTITLLEPALFTRSRPRCPGAVSQDRRRPAGHRRRRHRLPRRRPPRLRRRPRPTARSPATSTANTHPRRKPAAQTRHVPLRLRLHERRPRLTRLLRPAKSPRQNPHPSPPPPRPPTHQRPVCHAPRRHLLRSPDPKA